MNNQLLCKTNACFLIIWLNLEAEGLTGSFTIGLSSFSSLTRVFWKLSRSTSYCLKLNFISRFGCSVCLTCGGFKVILSFLCGLLYGRHFIWLRGNILLLCYGAGVLIVLWIWNGVRFLILRFDIMLRRLVLSLRIDINALESSNVGDNSVSSIDCRTQSNSFLCILWSLVSLADSKPAANTDVRPLTKPWLDS